MKKIFSLSIYSLLFFVSAFSFADAKSVTWNTTVNGTMNYFWNFAGRAGYENTASGWEPALSNPNIGITYNAQVQNMSAGGTLVNDGASLPVGTQLKFSPAVHSDADISWFGTGRSSDSPNGHWREGADAPSVTCSSQDFVGRAYYNGDTNTDPYDVYIPLSINPPTKTVNHAGTATLSCDGSRENCTITGPGTINTTFTFSDTTGKFYYRYYDFRAGFGGPGCFGNSTPLASPQSCSTTTERVCYDVPNCGNDYNPGSRYEIEYGIYDPYCETTVEQCSDVTTTSCGGAQSYILQVPQRTIPYTITATGSGNSAPNAPTISGPTTGSANQAYSFNIQATDPNGDNVRYGIDWDNNGSIDAWAPGSGYGASNNIQTGIQTWAVDGSKTFQALTQDSNGAQSGWTSHTIVLSTPTVPAPSANLTINGSEGPLSVARGTSLNIAWSSANVTSCTAWGSGWGSGSAVALTGTASSSANQTDTYILQCTNGTTTVTDSIQVNLTNSLKICQNSCSSGIMRGDANSTGSFTLARGGQQNLVACFNSDAGCSEGSGDNTSGATWSEGGSSVVSLSGSSPKTVTGDNTGTENISANYSGQTATTSVTVTCVPTVSCDNAPGRENSCENETFTVDNGCGVQITCNGTKTCNYNWKEVSP